MALLAGVNYDPATAATKATSALLAMTAIDTTNLRLTFTPPASGIVLVRIRCAMSGSATSAQVLLGVMSGATVMGRAAPIGGAANSAASTRLPLEALFLVTGLAGSQTWDAAYAVQVAVASTLLEYGGPDNAVSNDAWGGFSFEVWDTAQLLAGKLYDPSTAVSKVTTSLLAMTAFDTTNLRLTFTAPASGKVLVRLRVLNQDTAATTFASVLLGVLEASTVVGRCAPVGGRTNLTATTGDFTVLDAEFLITGISGGSHTYDAAYGVEVATASTGFSYGGPNNATGANAWGGAAFEVWAA